MANQVGLRMHIPHLRDVMETAERIVGVFGYICIPGICQTAATVRVAIAATQLAIGIITSSYHAALGLKAKLSGDGAEAEILFGRAKQDLQWCEHAVLNVMRAVVEYFNIGIPTLLILALWDNLGLKISHLDGQSPFKQLAQRIDYLQAAFSPASYRDPANEPAAAERAAHEPEADDFVVVDVNQFPEDAA